MKVKDVIEKLDKLSEKRIDEISLIYRNTFIEEGSVKMPEYEEEGSLERIKELNAERKKLMELEVAKMGLCKDCKYFTEVSRPNCTGFDDEPIFEGKKIGVCSCSKFVYLWSDRYNKSCSGEEYEELVIEDDMLTYEDFEGYSASFNVGQNFGCVHFEEDK